MQRSKHGWHVMLAYLVCAGASPARVVLLHEGLLAWHATRATARFVGQSFHALLQKPLHPLVDKATADPDRRGNSSERYAIGQE